MEMIMGSEEALKISGENTIEAAAEYFHSTLVSSFIITNGANDLFAGSNGVLFENTGIVKFPVSKMIEYRLKSNPQRKGDTTGCGDNFAGGIITSIALQLKNKKKGNFSLPEAISWGVSSVGNCCFTIGGTYLETTPGEIKQNIQSLQGAYLEQIKNH
jgi:sugar/nucleoside kinase (ribokinase family)